MEQCWAECPDVRPDISDIKKTLRAINDGKCFIVVNRLSRYTILYPMYSCLSIIVQYRDNKLGRWLLARGSINFCNVGDSSFIFESLPY